MEKEAGSYIVSLGAVLLIPILLIGVIIIGIPFLLFFLVKNTIENTNSRKKLKQLIRENNGAVYFIYADYNNYDFSKCIKERFNTINCLNANEFRSDDLLACYLLRGSYSKNYPRLVKIQGEALISKQHYNSFKHFYKRNDDIESFWLLINQSIQNLKRD